MFISSSEEEKNRTLPGFSSWTLFEMLSIILQLVPCFILQIKLVHDTVNGKPRGYAFIEYEHEGDMHCEYTAL